MLGTTEPTFHHLHLCAVWLPVSHTQFFVSSLVKELGCFHNLGRGSLGSEFSGSSVHVSCPVAWTVPVVAIAPAPNLGHCMVLKPKSHAEDGASTRHKQILGTRRRPTHRRLE